MRFLVIGLCCLLVACQPAATPFPVDIPTPATATPTPGPAQPVRYAFAANTAGAMPNPEAQYPQAELTQLTDPVDLADLGTRFDIIIALGAYPDAVPSPTLLNYMLLINDILPPLDNPLLRDIVTRSIEPSALVQHLQITEVRVTPRAPADMPDLRAELANAGWPDGFDLRLAHETALGYNVLRDHFQGLNINLISVPLSTEFTQTNLTLVTWSSLREREQWVEQAAGAIELFGLPVSYWAVPELTVAFTSQGWPVAQR